MSEPIPAVPAIPDLTAAALLAELVVTLHTDPLTTVIVSRPAFDRPFYELHEGALSLSFYGISDGAQVLAAAKSFFGGDVTIEPKHSGDETHTLATLWGGVPLKVSVPIRREDEVTELRKQVEELKAREAYRQAQLDEQRHQAVDPAVPVPAYTAGVTV